MKINRVKSIIAAAIIFVIYIVFSHKNKSVFDESKAVIDEVETSENQEFKTKQQNLSIKDDDKSKLNISNWNKNNRLFVKDLIPGSGKQINDHSIVSFHIVMQDMDGKVIFNSRKNLKVWNGTIGDGSFISGIDIGIRGMFLGGKRALWIPSNLAYGKGGIPGQVKPDSRLYAEIEIISIN